LRLRVGTLTAPNENRIADQHVNVRWARYHQKVMSYGHGNNDFNYQEWQLVRRPTFDLLPGVARRAYLEIAVPAETRAGVYRAIITVEDAQGDNLAEQPLVLEVLPLELSHPPVFFASNNGSPEYGFNVALGREEAVKKQLQGYLIYTGYDWAEFLKHKEKWKGIYQNQTAGKGPRGFFGGMAPGSSWQNPRAAANARAFYDDLLKEFPRLDILGVTVPVYASPRCTESPHDWLVFRSNGYTNLPPGTAEVLQAARASGKDFWFLDGIKASKEQAARFTYGFWLWALGARGRYSTLGTDLYGRNRHGTARGSYPWEPYYALIGGGVDNVEYPFMPALAEGQINPCRDLVLIREGITDYRYLHTLETLLARAGPLEKARAVVAARQFLEDLRVGLSLDLTHYYLMRSGAYGENWYPLPGNPWTGARFDQVRRQTAEHILAVKKALGE
jgi:hypothetical protein